MVSAALPVEGGRRSVLAGLSPLRPRRTRSQWVVDWLLFAFALLVGASYWDPAGDGAAGIPDWFQPWDYAMGILACCALWWSRSHPLAVGLVVFVPAALSASAAFAVVVVIYRMGARLRPRVSVPLVAGYLAAAIPYHALFPIPEVDWPSYLIVITLLHLLVLSFGLLTRSRRLVLEGLRAEAAREREAAAARLDGARRAERERIAREMHDVLAHRVSLLSVHAGALEYRTAGEAPPTLDEVRAAAAVIRHNAHLAVEELRQVLVVLRDTAATGTAPEEVPDAPPERPQPLLRDVPQLVDEARDAGQRVSAQLDLEPLADLPDNVQRTVYRTVQEGLTNARKHAAGAIVTVDVGPADGQVRVEVANVLPVGVTASEIPGIGAGLIGLAERVRLDGGRFEHGVHDGEFRLAAYLPRGRA
ncbi:sensor histidine kinase [Promicromonospora iranensis]|uniref:sensor histidine kinase n=1 Tax=Promicromonospora iranensis TaxID=1105144 RepID=UPI0023AA03C1|nr:sensor histidine kinase [Promicromonospora iranensis]